MHGQSLFPLGRIVATPGVLERISQSDVLDALSRHAGGDWGNVEEHDRKANNAALRSQGRLLSVYQTALNIVFWIITEADRSATTVLLPDEY